MSEGKHSFRVHPDQFHHKYCSRMGPVLVPFLAHLLGFEVEGEVRNALTIHFQKNPLQSETEPFNKTMLDGLYEVRTKAAGASEFVATAIQVEHQHRNQDKLNYRMFNYLNALAQHYKDEDEVYQIIQVLVYTGDEPFNSETLLTFFDSTYSYRVVDYTQLDPKECLEHPEFGIQFLCIFNHKISDADKVRILLAGFRAYYEKNGRDATQFFIDLIPLGMTKHNVGAIDTLTEQLRTINTEFDEMVQLSTFYRKVREESIEIGKEEGLEEGKVLGKVEGLEEGKILTAMTLIRNGLVSLEAVAQTLALTPEEVAAIELLLQQSSNGNGSNGAHV